jgi:hypothetical protein
MPEEPASQRPAYRAALREHVKAALESKNISDLILRNLCGATVGIVTLLAVHWFLGWSLVAWKALTVTAGSIIVGAILGPLLYRFVLRIYYRLNAPKEIWEANQQTIEELSTQLATKTETSIAAKVSRHVKGAISNLFDAYRALEIVSNRTNDDAWSALSQRLEEYKAAYALLPPIARRFHERSESVLTSLVRARMFERLLEVMNDASDIMLNGECWLDLTISSPHPMVITNRASRRDRFVILNIIVGNREDQAVSLFPVWHLYVDPGRMHITYQPDAEPLKDWEELRREVPRPANPALAMPLQLSPKGAATGYWCFFIGNSLENDKRLLDGRRHIETVLEIHDLASGRRTKSDRFYLELDLIQSLLSPLPPEQADDGEPTP